MSYTRTGNTIRHPAPPSGRGTAVLAHWERLRRERPAREVRGRREALESARQLRLDFDPAPAVEPEADPANRNHGADLPTEPVTDEAIEIFN